MALTKVKLEKFAKFKVKEEAAIEGGNQTPELQEYGNRILVGW